MSDSEHSVLYCPICDEYFIDEAARAVHVQLSTRHPMCEPCGVRFANGHCLRVHWCSSHRHHYCAACEKHFRTAAGLRVHLERAAVHRDDDDDDDDDDEETLFVYGPDWEDDLGRQLYPDEAEQRADDDFDAPEEIEIDPFMPPLEDHVWFDDDELQYDEEEAAYFGYSYISYVGPSIAETFGPSPTPVANLPVSSSSAMSTLEEAEKSDTVQKPSTGIDAGGFVFDCPLCLEPARDVSATRCGHVFCTPCINMALYAKHNCPVCRTSSVPLQLRRLYLSNN